MAAAASLWSPPAAANDSGFGGAGTRLIPLNEHRVHMVSEDIVMTARGDDWEVEATYVFENTSSKVVTMQVGFPELRCIPDMDCENQPFRELRTLVGGKPVKHRKGTLAKEEPWSQYLGLVWLFDATFAPKRPLKIQHHYRMASSGNVAQLQSTSYIVKTGKNWLGSIGHARFTFRVPKHVHVIWAPEVPGLKTTGPKLTQDGWLQLVFEGKDWTPEKDVRGGYYASNLITAYLEEPANKLREGCFLMRSQTVMARDCINLIYASRGYPFRSAKLRKLYYGGNPQFQKDTEDGIRVYRRDFLPLADFSPEWFSHWEQAVLKDLRQRETQEKSAASSKPSPP